jgi:MoxR-like ATPase
MNRPAQPNWTDQPPAAIALQEDEEQWSYEELRDQAEDIRQRLHLFRQSLGQFFVQKQEIIDLMCVAAIAQEPLLLVGPPGTAKSDLVIKFKEALGVPDGEYFEYMLTRFTEPSEILGAIDIQELREGRYVRRKEGKLPTARIAFLDEIFKSNSAILNILLTILNERKFYQEGRPEPVPLRILFAATNEIPEHGELAALRDRFVLKVESRSVHPEAEKFVELIDQGLRNEAWRMLNQKPWCQGHATLTDFLKAHRYFMYLFSESRQEFPSGELVNDRTQYFPPDVLNEFRRLIRTISKENGIFVSDRKVVKLYKLLRVRAWLFHGGVVCREDLQLLQYLGETLQEMKLLREKIPQYLGLH